MNTNTLLRFGLLGILVIVILVLVGWFFFLRGYQGEIAAFDAARGGGEDTPTFRNSIGSTYENVAGNSGFGGIIATLPTLSDTSSATGTPALPRLWQITKNPVAGAGFIEKRETGIATSTGVRFVERGTGYILEADPMTGTLSRITNTLVPRIYEALIGKNGAVILRSLDEGGNVVTAIGHATSTPSDGEGLGSLVVTPLSQNIRSITVLPDGDFLYLVASANGATVMRKEGGKEAEGIAALGVSGWHIRSYSDVTLLTQNPSSNTVNHAYTLGEGGALVETVPPARDLYVLPRENSSALLYSAGFSLYGRIGATTSTITLPVRTTAEKCVWAPGTSLIAYCAVPQTSPTSALDAWRRGEMHTRDGWWRIDVSAGQAEQLYAPENAVIDVENPSIDSSGSYLLFMNRIDKSLWSLRVNG
ncbi:hypothetical protein C4585_02845 [Candidatus Parcubacteria bacterium]|nr:MAG: hypothetical protein C4585_02845 [Candidatus Parcubacteria bacterium]